MAFCSELGAYWGHYQVSPGHESYPVQDLCMDIQRESGPQCGQSLTLFSLLATQTAILGYVGLLWTAEKTSPLLRGCRKVSGSAGLKLGSCGGLNEKCPA